MKQFIIPLLIIFTLASCRAVHETTEHTAYAAHADTVRLYEMHRDSIYLRDSIFTSLITQGDTVYLTKLVTRYKYRDRWRTDTVYRAKTDTVQGVKEVDKLQEAEHNVWAPTLTTICLASLAILTGIIYYNKSC